MKIKNFILLNLLSFPSFLIILAVTSIAYHQPQDISVVFFTDLFYQGLTYAVSALVVMFLLIRLFVIFKKRKSDLSLILVGYFINTLLNSALQAFLGFFKFNDENLQLLGETSSVILIVSTQFVFWFFLFELFKDGEKGTRFNLKSRLILFVYLGSAVLGIFQGMVGSMTSTIVIIITLPLVILNVYLYAAVARNGISLSKRIGEKKEKMGLLFIGYSGIFIVCTSILAFLDYVLFDQSVVSGTIVGILYLIGYIFLYLGFTIPKKSSKDEIQ